MNAFKQTKGEKIFQFFNSVFMVLLSLIFILPFWSVLVTSVISESESARRGSFILFPEGICLDAYKLLLSEGGIIYNAYAVTAFVVIVGTICNMLVTTMLAYGLSKRDLIGRNFFNTMIFITMLINGGLIPNFILNKSLGLIDNIWVLIMPSLVNAWNMFILRNFFYSIPVSLEEAAYIDGANPVTILFKVVLPLSAPALVTIGLFYAVSHWNSWFTAALYINDIKKLPVQNIMRKIVLNNDLTQMNEDSYIFENPPTAETIKSATIIISTLPIICIYPYIQKYFVKGIMVGSIKG